MKILQRKNRQLIKYLTLRELKARYSQSFLGFFWVILNPFFQMLIMAFVFSHIIRLPDLNVPYSLFIFAGLLPWLFFNTATSNAVDVYVINDSLLKKVYFPREILVLSSLLAKFVDFILSLLLFLIMMIWFRIDFTWYMLYFFPILCIQLVFTYAISLAVATVNLFYRDIKYIFNLLLRVWFYVTPIIYTVEVFPAQYRWIFKINPMSVFVNAYREVLLSGGAPNFVSLIIGTGISFVMLWIAMMIFKKLEGMFADIA